MGDPKFSYQLLLPVIVNLSRYLQVGVPASCPEERDSLWSMLAAHMVELAAWKHLNFHSSADSLTNSNLFVHTSAQMEKELGSTLHGTIEEAAAS